MLLGQQHLTLWLAFSRGAFSLYFRRIARKKRNRGKAMWKDSPSKECFSSYFGDFLAKIFCIAVKMFAEKGFISSCGKCSPRTGEG